MLGMVVGVHVRNKSFKGLLPCKATKVLPKRSRIAAKIRKPFILLFSIKKRIASKPYNESIIVNIIGPILLINKSIGRCISINVVPEIL